jgi:hypothetical protein
MSRVKLNGALKPMASWDTASFITTELQTPQPTKANLAYLMRRAQQRTSILVQEILPDELQGSAEQRLCELLNCKSQSWDSNDPYVICAKKEGMSRRKALEEELESVNAQLDRDIKGLTAVFHECALLCEEVEADMIFPMEISVAA